MSDMQSMDRENKKRQLRQNIVQMPDNGSEEPMNGGRLAKYKRKKRIIAAAAVCFIAALGFTGYRYMNEYEYTGYSVQWERSMRYTENSGADKKTQAAETSAAADSAGTDGAGEHVDVVLGQVGADSRDDADGVLTDDGDDCLVHGSPWSYTKSG